MFPLPYSQLTDRRPGIVLSSGSAAPSLHSAHTLQAVGRWSAVAGGRPELQHVVGRTDQRPFAADLVMAPRQELPEPASLLDLAEDRPDRDFPFGVQASPALRAQRAAHAVSDREPRGNPAARDRRACPSVRCRSGGIRGMQPNAVRAGTLSSLK